MRVFSIGFIVFLVFAIFSRWYFICELRNRCGSDGSGKDRVASLSLEHGGKAILQGYEQFRFKSRSYDPVLTTNNREFVLKVSEFLSQNTDKNMVLTGRFLSQEKQAASGFFENLGIARAISIEKLLEKHGIDEKRISIDYQLMSGDILEEPVSFELYNAEKGAAGPFEKLQFSFMDNTFSDANFEYNSDKFQPGLHCMAYADSVARYLNIHPEKYLSVTGHTDSIGTEEYNFELGLKRAQSAAQYFLSIGVKSTIEVASKGESQPIVSNGDPQGRQKNRRVNFKIQEKALK